MNYNKKSIIQWLLSKHTESWEIEYGLHLKHYRILCQTQVFTIFQHFDVWWLSDGFLMLFPYLAAGRAVVNRVAEG